MFHHHQHLFAKILTRWIIPAAVSHTEMKIDTSCARRIELEVLSMLRYCRISGTVIRRNALRNLKPADNGTSSQSRKNLHVRVLSNFLLSTTQNQKHKSWPRQQNSKDFIYLINVTLNLFGSQYSALTGWRKVTINALVLFLELLFS